MAVTKICPDGTDLIEKDKGKFKPIEVIKLVTTQNKDDEKVLYDMLGTKDNHRELD